MLQLTFTKYLVADLDGSACPFAEVSKPNDLEICKAQEYDRL